MEGQYIGVEGMLNIYRRGLQKCLKEIGEKEDELMQSIVDDNLCKMQVVISFEPTAVPTYTIIRECMPRYDEKAADRVRNDRAVGQKEKRQGKQGEERLMENKDIDFSKCMDFEVLGDIKPTIIKILGYYDTHMTSDCDLHLKGSGISLPAYWRYLTYWGSMSCKVDKTIIQALLDENLIKFHDFH